MAYLYTLIQDAIVTDRWPLRLCDPDGAILRVDRETCAIYYVNDIDNCVSTAVIPACDLVSDKWQRIRAEIDWSKVRHGSEGFTRCGIKVRILCTDRKKKTEGTCIVALTNEGGEEVVRDYNAAGYYSPDPVEDPCDIVEITKY